MASGIRCKEILKKTNISTCIAFAVSMRLILSSKTKFLNSCKVLVRLVYKEQQLNEAEKGQPQA